MYVGIGRSAVCVSTYLRIYIFLGSQWTSVCHRKYIKFKQNSLYLSLTHTHSDTPMSGQMQKFSSKLFGESWLGGGLGNSVSQAQFLAQSQFQSQAKGLSPGPFATLYFKFKWSSHVATKHHPSAHTHPHRGLLSSMLKDFVYRIGIRIQIRIRFKCEFISNKNITKVKDRAASPTPHHPALPWQKGHFWA